MPENTHNDVFLGALNGFLVGEPHLGCRKVSGFPVSFGLVETRNLLFYTREKFPRPGEFPAHFFNVQNAPYMY
jgi:hypothetical protein